MGPRATLLTAKKIHERRPGQPPQPAARVARRRRRRRVRRKPAPRGPPRDRPGSRGGGAPRLAQALRPTLRPRLRAALARRGDGRLPDVGRRGRDASLRAVSRAPVLESAEHLSTRANRRQIVRPIDHGSALCLHRAIPWHHPPRSREDRRMPRAIVQPRSAFVGSSPPRPLRRCRFAAVPLVSDEATRASTSSPDRRSRASTPS